MVLMDRDFGAGWRLLRRVVSPGANAGVFVGRRTLAVRADRQGFIMHIPESLDNSISNGLVSNLHHRYFLFTVEALIKEEDDD